MPTLPKAPDSNPCLPATQFCPVFSITYSAGCFSVSNLGRPRRGNSCALTTIKVAPADNRATVSRARVPSAHPRTERGRRVVWPGRSFLVNPASSVAPGDSRSHVTGLMSTPRCQFSPTQGIRRNRTAFVHWLPTSAALPRLPLMKSINGPVRMMWKITPLTKMSARPCSSTDRCRRGVDDPSRYRYEQNERGKCTGAKASSCQAA